MATRKRSTKTAASAKASTKGQKPADKKPAANKRKRKAAAQPAESKAKPADDKASSKKKKALPVDEDPNPRGLQTHWAVPMACVILVDVNADEPDMKKDRGRAIRSATIAFEKLCKEADFLTGFVVAPERESEAYACDDDYREAVPVVRPKPEKKAKRTAEEVQAKLDKPAADASDPKTVKAAEKIALRTAKELESMTVKEIKAYFTEVGAPFSNKASKAALIDGYKVSRKKLIAAARKAA